MCTGPTSKWPQHGAVSCLGCSVFTSKLRKGEVRSHRKCCMVFGSTIGSVSAAWRTSLRSKVTGQADTSLSPSFDLNELTLAMFSILQHSFMVTEAVWYISLIRYCTSCSMVRVVDLGSVCTPVHESLVALGRASGRSCSFAPEEVPVFTCLLHAVKCIRFYFWYCLWLFCLCMKCPRNCWTDLHQIHREDVFGFSLRRVWRSRSPWTKRHFWPFWRPACGLCFVKHFSL